MTERWQGAFATANHAGAACAIVLVAAVAALAARPTATRARFPDGLLLWIAAAASAVGLAASQSRSATFGVLVAWLLAGLPGGKRAKAAAVTATVLAGAWLIWTRGVSVVPGNHDVSTVHHLRLWTDACTFVFSNPLGGCGWGRFGQFWQDWLEPLGWQFGFTSALSSPLTLLAELGIPAGFLLLAASIAPAAAPADTSPLRSARSAWVAALVAGASCTLQRDPLVVGLLAAIAAWWAWAWLVRNSETGGDGLGRALAVAGAAAGAFCLAAVAVGWVVGGYRIVIHPNPDASAALIPRRPIGMAIVVRGFGSGPLRGNTVLSDMADAGWAVVVMDQLPGPDKLAAAIESAKQMGAVRVLASGAGAQVIRPGIGVPVIYVDPWFGASDAAPPETAAVLRSSDYADETEFRRAILKTAVQ